MPGVEDHLLWGKTVDPGAAADWNKARQLELLELPWLGLAGSHQPQLEEQPQLPDP
jgi:hypothetical protein